MQWDSLIAACARDRANAALWVEFLRRYAPRIKLFIRGVRRLSMTGSSLSSGMASGGMQESDLFQSTILRLVEQDCAAMKRFSGKSEAEWLAYLAVITRSVLRDEQRRQRRAKRTRSEVAGEFSSREKEMSPFLKAGSDQVAMERKLLAREIRDLSEQTIQGLDKEYSARNLLIFQLYFNQDLSAEQIAGCQGVNLSRTGVAKVIDQLKVRIRSVVSTVTSGCEPSADRLLWPLRPRQIYALTAGDLLSRQVLVEVKLKDQQISGGVLLIKTLNGLFRQVPDLTRELLRFMAT